MKKYNLVIQYSSSQGILIRIALLLERRSYTVHSVIFSDENESEDKSIRLTISGDPAKFEQVVKQLAKLVDVIDVMDCTSMAMSSENNFAMAKSISVS